MAITDKVKQKKVKYKSNKTKSLVIYGVVSVAFLIGFIGVIMYANTFKSEVQVVSITEPISGGTLIEESKLSPMGVPERYYNDGMVKWEDRDQYIGMYSAHFIRNNTEVYSDMFAEEQPLKTPYLYNLENDQELVTFPYEIGEAGGKLVRPGDRLRVRGSYIMPNDGGEDTTSDTMTKEELEERTVVDIIFDVVEVQDLLNSENESIVDIINEAERLPQSDRELLMSSDEFVNRITPRAILMVVQTEDVDKYVEFEANEKPNYTITMLSRNEELQTNDLNTGSSLWNLLEQMKQDQGVSVEE